MHIKITITRSLAHKFENAKTNIKDFARNLLYNHNEQFRNYKYSYYNTSSTPK